MRNPVVFFSCLFCLVTPVSAARASHCLTRASHATPEFRARGDRLGAARDAGPSCFVARWP
jgi:hypothetical protein